MLCELYVQAASVKSLVRTCKIIVAITGNWNRFRKIPSRTEPPHSRVYIRPETVRNVVWAIYRCVRNMTFRNKDAIRNKGTCRFPIHDPAVSVKKSNIGRALVLPCCRPSAVSYLADPLQPSPHRPDSHSWSSPRYWWWRRAPRRTPSRSWTRNTIASHPIGFAAPEKLTRNARWRVRVQRLLWLFPSARGLWVLIWDQLLGLDSRATRWIRSAWCCWSERTARSKKIVTLYSWSSLSLYYRDGVKPSKFLLRVKANVSASPSESQVESFPSHQTRKALH